MSSPEVQGQPIAPEPAMPAEPSSLIRWLVLAALIVALAGAMTVVVRMLPAEASEGGAGTDFPVPVARKGPPGKVVLSEDTTYKFGVMPQLTKGTRTWVIKNEGKGDVELSKGPSTCSCTIANFSNEKKSFTLAPGASTEITLTWETREFDGHYEKSATINVLGDPERSHIVLAVEGTVRPAIIVMPKERVLTFGDIPGDQSQSGKFAIISTDKPDFKIVALTSSRPEEIGLAFVPLPDEDRKALEWTAMPGGYLIQFELKPSKSLGVFNEEIVVTTDHPLAKELRLTVGGKRIGPISLIPETVRLHNVSPDQGASNTVMITVRNAPDTAFEVLSKPDNLKVEITPSDVRIGSVAKVRQYRLTVTVPPGAPEGVINSTIVLKSSHPQADRVTVPVDITVVGH